MTRRLMELYHEYTERLRNNAVAGRYLLETHRKECNASCLWKCICCRSHGPAAQLVRGKQVYYWEMLLKPNNDKTMINQEGGGVDGDSDRGGTPVPEEKTAILQNRDSSNQDREGHGETIFVCFSRFQQVTF